MPTAIQIRNISQTFGGHKGAHIDRLDINAGKITALLGRSGSGKSTILHVISGMCNFESDQEGVELRLALRTKDGLREIDAVKDGWTEIRRHIGFVFQESYLIGPVSGRSNWNLSLATAKKTADTDTIKDLWAALNLPDDQLETPAVEYSGGQKQRAAVGRAIVRDPTIIFADEPTASLDPELARAVMERLKEWVDSGKDNTLVLVTHDLEIVNDFADEIVVMEKPKSVPDSSDDALAVEMPGTLVAGMAFPMSNPRDTSVLKSLIYGNVEFEADGNAKVNSMDGLSDYPLLASLLTVMRIGEQAVSKVDKDTQLPKALVAFRGALRILSFSLILVVVFSAVTEKQHDFIRILPAAFKTTENSPSFTFILFFSISVLSTTFYIVALLTRTKKMKMLVEAFVFTTILVAALAISTVNQISAVSYERDMADPGLQPLLVNRAAAGMGESEINEIESELDSLTVGQLGFSQETSVFGRYHAYIGLWPVFQATDTAGDNCSQGSATPVEWSILAPQAVEPFGTGLRVMNIGHEILKVSKKWKAEDLEETIRKFGKEDRFLAKLHYAPISPNEDNDAIPSVFSKNEKSSPNSEIILTARKYAELTASRPGTLKYICIPAYRGGADNFHYQRYDIAGIVAEVPDFDGRVYDAVLPFKAGSLLVPGVKGPFLPSEQFSIASIWIEPSHREASLKKITRLRDKGLLQTLPNFAQLTEVFVAAERSTSALQSMSIFILMAGAFILFQMIRITMGNLRTQVAVARAFGAMMPHVFAFLLGATYRPVLIACVSTAVSAVLMKSTILRLFYSEEMNQIHADLPLADMIVFLNLFFIFTWLIVVLLYTTFSLWISPSIASQIQENE